MAKSFVHYVRAIDAIAVGHEPVLTGAIMHEERVGIIASPDRKRMATCRHRAKRTLHQVLTNGLFGHDRTVKRSSIVE